MLWSMFYFEIDCGIDNILIYQDTKENSKFTKMCIF